MKTIRKAIGTGLVTAVLAANLTACKQDDTPGFSMTDARPLAVLYEVAGGKYQAVDMGDGVTGYRMNFDLLGDQPAYSSNVCINDPITEEQKEAGTPILDACVTGPADSQYTP